MLFHIHSAAQNSFMPTAFSRSSVYALASSLGSPPVRKLGAQLTLEVTVNSLLTSGITLPKFSTFSGRGLKWYTIEDIIIPAGAIGQTVSFEVRQGERVTDSFVSTGKDFQRIEIGEDFNVDNSFLTVVVDGVEYTNNGATLLTAEIGDEIYSEEVTSSGRVKILFGNSVIGSVPIIDVPIDISYSNTVGLNSNSSITGDDFQYTSEFDLGGLNFLQLLGVAQTTASGGANEQSVDTIKATSPRLFAANKRAVRRDDYEGHIINFTGSTAARAWGEFEEASEKGFADLTMMNRVFITSIPNSLSIQEDVGFETGDGIDLSFSETSSLNNMIPGSVVITSDTDIFTDRDGRGILTSDTVSYDEIDGSGVSTANDSPAIAFRAFDGVLTVPWTTTIAPSVFTPLRVAYDFGVGFEEDITSIRIASSDDTSIQDRAFPKTVKILASNLVAPDINDPDDWEVVRGIVSLEDPGFNNYSRWIPLDTVALTTYRHVAVEVLDRHGTLATTKIADIQVQNRSNSSTVNYENGQIELVYANAPTGSIDVSALLSSLTSTEKNNLITYLNDFNHFTTIIEYQDPIARLVDVVASVYYLEGFEPTTILSEVQTAIDNLFTVKSDSISKPLKLSDVYQAIQDVEGVDYSIVESPTTNIEVERNEWVYLSSKIINIFPTDR